MREIVRIGIINWDEDDRGAESLCKRLRKGTAPNNHNHPHYPPNNPYATTMRNTVRKTYLNPTHTYLIMWQFSLMLQLCANVCATKMEIQPIIPINLILFQLCATHCANLLNLKLSQLLLFVVFKEQIIEHFLTNFFIILDSIVLFDFLTEFLLILIHFQDILACSRIAQTDTIENIVSTNLRVVVPQDTDDSFHIRYNKHKSANTDITNRFTLTNFILLFFWVVMLINWRLMR